MSVPTTMRGLVPDATQPHLVRLSDHLALPVPKKGEVLVRVTDTTVNGHEFELARKGSVRLMAWLYGARGEVRSGLEFSGVVASNGETFRQGDRVMGYVEMIAGYKPHADYVAIPEAYIARVPNTVSMAEASTLPMSGLTALVAVRDVAAVKDGQSVLIAGASGGVGVLAVQLAKRAGARVTAVASSTHEAALRARGADDVIDYRETPIAEIPGPFDAVFDFSDTLTFKQVKPLLAPHGAYVAADPLRNLTDILLHKQAKYLMVDRGRTGGLDEIAQLVDRGELSPVVDRMFSATAWQDAVAYAHTRGRFGRTVLQFSEQV